MENVSFCKSVCDMVPPNAEAVELDVVLDEEISDFELGEELKDLYSWPLYNGEHVLRFIEDPLLF